MAKAPSAEKLKTLYYQKGKDALVWYAWRSTLRYLTYVGMNKPLTQDWKTNTVQHVYAMCRPSLILAQWLNIRKPHMLTINSAMSAAWEAQQAATGLIGQRGASLAASACDIAAMQGPENFYGINEDITYLKSMGYS